MIPAGDSPAPKNRGPGEPWSKPGVARDRDFLAEVVVIIKWYGITDTYEAGFYY